MELFAKGKRSLIYKEKDIIIKEEKTNIQANNHLRNESEWLKKVNKYNIGPKYLQFKENKLYIEYIQGPHLKEFLHTANKEEKKQIFKQLLQQAYILDQLKVNKLEMHRITKNAIVQKKKLILLDFERCKKTPTPKNVTQACQFITKHLPNKELQEKARAYKKAYAKNAFQELLKCMTNTS